MPVLVERATRIQVPGNKLVEEYVGRVNSGHSGVSIAHMHSPTGWSEPGQQPDFDEFTIVPPGYFVKLPACSGFVKSVTERLPLLRLSSRRSKPTCVRPAHSRLSRV